MLKNSTAYWLTQKTWYSWSVGILPCLSIQPIIVKSLDNHVEQDKNLGLLRPYPAIFDNAYLFIRFRKNLRPHDEGFQTDTEESLTKSFSLLNWICKTKLVTLSFSKRYVFSVHATTWKRSLHPEHYFISESSGYVWKEGQNGQINMRFFKNIRIRVDLSIWLLWLTICYMSNFQVLYRSKTMLGQYIDFYSFFSTKPQWMLQTNMEILLCIMHVFGIMKQ